MSPSPADVPEDWDRLRDRSGPVEEPPDTGQDPRSEPVSLLLLAAAWGDLVCLVTVCTAGLGALALLGHGAPLAALPWSVALAVAWWCIATIALVLVRRSTPGMQLAGLVFDEPVAGRHVLRLLLAALISAGLLGLPTIFGARRSPLAWAAAAGITRL